MVVFWGHPSRAQGKAVVEVDRVEEWRLLQVGEQHHCGRPVVPAGFADSLGEDAHGALVVVQGEADLLEVVDALGTPGRLARRLHGGQQQGDQHGDDRDDHQQFDQREASTFHGSGSLQGWEGG